MTTNTTTITNTPTIELLTLLHQYESLHTNANDNLKSCKSVNLGSEIVIPYHYCQKIIVYIDKKLELLVKLEIFDWNGNLYETYQYKNLLNIFNRNLFMLILFPDNYFSVCNYI